MAKIRFYDSTDLDRAQLSAGLQHTDHTWDFVDSKITLDTIDPDAEVISVFVTSIVSAAMIDAMPKLRVIACRSTGFNNIDIAAAEARDISILNVPTYGEATVAAYAFTLLLALTRRVPQLADAEHEPLDHTKLLGSDITGKTIGIIGTGHIGQHAITIANGFGMQVLAYDPYPHNELTDDLHFSYVDLDTLLQSADVISIHAPYVPSTHHLLNAEKLALTKKGAILINTARGEIVDTTALVEALASGQLGGAGLDVIEGEALLDHHEEIALLRKQDLSPELLRHSVEISLLKKMPNVILSPHVAYNTIEAVQRINDTTVKNIIDYWYGHSPNRIAAPDIPMGTLFIARHAESEWNATGLWSGITDVHLSEAGFHQSGQLGLALAKFDKKIDIAYCSEQIRTRETLEGMLDASQQFTVDILRDGAINERDYGDYTGKNKWEVQQAIGEDAFEMLRRGWDVTVPHGETLRTVYHRVLPFYKAVVLPRLKRGQNVLLVSHGNSLRALMKFIESIPVEKVDELEMLFGEVVAYEVNEKGKMTSKKVERIDFTPPHA